MLRHIFGKEWIGDSNLQLLAERVALISGVGPGLGRETALLFARHGAALALLARSSRTSDAIRRELGQGSECLVIQGDVSQVEDCDRAVAQVVDRFGRLDILVNMAYQPLHEGFLDTTPDFATWRAIFDVNFFGTMQITRSVVDYLLAQSTGGAIVMVNSMTAEKPIVGRGAYGASKSAIAAMTRTLALELGEYNIRVNGVHPGWMWGPRSQLVLEQRAAANHTSMESERALLENEMALKRMPDSHDCAGTILYLASDLAAPVTGQAVHVNGGHWFH